MDCSPAKDRRLGATDERDNVQARWKKLARAPRAVPRVLLSLARLRLAGRLPKLAAPIVSFRHTQIVADLHTPLGLQLYRYGLTDPDFDLLASLVWPGSVMIDCGANVGLFTIAACGGGAGTVYAVEPAESTRLALQRNLDVAKLTNVVVLPYALGDESGVVEFTVMPGNGGLSSFAPAEPGEGTPEQVEVRRLDDVVPRECWPRVSVVKIDVEGAEALLLDGATELLNASHPAVLIEMEDEHLVRQGSSVQSVRARLRALGYEQRPGACPPNELFVNATKTHE
jgi:FkbM family methyltransferase